MIESFFTFYPVLNVLYVIMLNSLCFIVDVLFEIVNWLYSVLSTEHWKLVYGVMTYG